MKIFVSGGAGFIGSHLCQKLLNEGHQVTAFDNLHLGKEKFLESCKRHSGFRFIKADLLNLEVVKKELAGHDLVYHMAANSDIAEGARRTDIDLQLGTVATYNVLEAMRIVGCKEIIFASTSAVYGEASVKPTPEDYGPLLPISFYGASKLACEALCTAFGHNFGMKVWIFRFANIVGNHATHGAIHDFVYRLKQDPEVLTVLGDGSQRKSYLHVSDCIDGMGFGYTHSKNDVQVFNLASEGVTRVKTIAEEVVAQMKMGSRIEYTGGDRGWRGDVPYTHLSGMAFGRLGWKARMNSDEAVKRAVADVVEEFR